MKLNYDSNFKQSLREKNYFKDIYKIRMNEFCDAYLNQSDNLVTNLNITRPKCSISPINEIEPVDLSNILTTAYQQFPLGFSTDSDHRVFQNETCLNFRNSYSPMMISCNKHKQNTTSLTNLSQDSGCYSYENSILGNASLVSNYKNRPKFSNNKLKYLDIPDVPKGQTHLQSTPNKQLLELNLKTRINFHSIVDLAQSASSQHNFSQKLDNNENSFQNQKYQINNKNHLEYINESSKLTFNEKLKLMSTSLMNNKENNHELNYKGKRKPRTQINKQQKEILEYAYKLKCYPDSNEVEYLCSILGFEENVVRIWFQNKRARDKIRQ